MRGKGLNGLLQPGLCRITPACAGKRRPRSDQNFKRSDHPRVCGEKEFGPAEVGPVEGSPPRVRGKVPASSWAGLLVWITPACAGKRPSTLWTFVRVRDHPRVCGEKWSIRWVTRARSGSPPRVRGKAVRAICKACRYWITPACAGKSPHKLPILSFIQDHPRVCGEKSLGARTSKAE